MEFRNKKISEHTQKKIIKDYKNKVKVNKIMDTYNISSGTIYYYLHKESEKTKKIKQLGGNIDQVYEQTSNQEPQQPEQTSKKEHRTNKKENKMMIEQKKFLLNIQTIHMLNQLIKIYYILL
jgi:DeoR/GlpR family transcriptional regulator of sugar metabolism